MTYVFDIDNTICRKEKDTDYTSSTPLYDRIDKINYLYDSGNTIIFHTARGMGRHNNDIDAATKQFYNMTKAQLSQWGVKYHTLFMGKPSGDIYVDDKGMRDEDFFRNEFRP
jgi:hypothetical protein